jgi:Carboxypeptidase regulatory-like domain
MKIKFLILCFLGLVAFTDCKKQETSGPSSVSGQVVDQTTGKGVPYAVIALLSQNSSIIGAWGQQQSSSGTTDANGKFSFAFNYASGNSYTVAAQAPNYFNDGDAFATLSAGQNNNVKIEMQPEGFVRFYLVNSHPLDTVFEFVLDDLGNSPIIQNLYKNTSFVVYGYGNTLTHFTYKINQYGSINGFVTYNDTVYIKALDTVAFIINY